MLIDAENISPYSMENIVNKATQHGDIVLKRIYGNFVNANGHWKFIINNLALKPIHQFSYISGKNASDSLLIIDAMDLMYTNRYDGFVIVSSDSDFTSLAIRLKEQSLKVYGIGQRTTPESFQKACTKFIYIDNLKTKTSEKEEILIDEKTQKIIQTIFESHNDEWMTTSEFGAKLKIIEPNFNVKNHGFKRLSDFVLGNPVLFKINEIKSNPEHKNQIWIKYLK